MNAIKTHSGSLSLRRHYPEQVIRVSLSFDLKNQSTPGETGDESI